MKYSLRSEFYRILIGARLGHGIKTRLVRINRQGIVEITGNPRWDIAPRIWKRYSATDSTEANMIADIEGTLELEGGHVSEFAGSRRHRSPVMRGIFAQPAARTGTL